MVFIEQLQKNVILFPERQAVSNGDSHIYTYGKLWDISGRIYGCLRNLGIGREDFVMINLPRGAEVIIACVGVWRAGAAVVVVDAGDSTERRDYVYSDAGCSLRIDAGLFEEMLSNETKQGYEAVEDHDAAYSCYTSGTTGRPKGAVHEFGVIEQCRHSYFYNGEYELAQTDRYAMLSPLNFVAVMIVFPSLLYVGGELVIVPLHIVKNTEALKEFFACNKITVSFLTPTFLRVFHDFNPEFRILYLASEPVKRVYFDQMDVYNVYAQSESGFLTTTFKIDQPYEVTPIGKCVIPGVDVRLITDEGMEAETGEIGELCFCNLYFRGYQNQPEMTEAVFSGGIFHSGDYGKKLADGNIVLLGRGDDMVKINGNRIEPAEIERVLREIMGVDWAAIKCVTIRDTVSIAAYYVGEPARSIEEVKTMAALKLPYYMVPSHYIKIDSIPVNANGKFTRKRLPDPDLSQKRKYTAPESEMERLLVRVFEEILNLEQIGIDDDFYELGGDSLKGIEIVSELNIDRLSVEQIFYERTIRKIAAYLEKTAKCSEDLIAQEQQEILELEKNGCKLLPYQQYFLDRQEQSLESEQYCIFHLPLFMQYAASIDTGRLAWAIREALLAHPLLRSRLWKDHEGRYYQRIAEYDLPLPETEKVTEEEIRRLSETFLQPWDLLDSPLYRLRLLQTEEHVYLFVDFHHVIADGTSLHIFINDVGRAYRGEILENDGIYGYLTRIDPEKIREAFQDGKAYYEQMYNGIPWSELPVRDHTAVHYYLDYYERDLTLDETAFDQLKKKYSGNQNVLFLAAALLAMAKYNQEMDVLGTWTFHGRDTQSGKQMVGPLLKDLPAALRIRKGMSVSDILSSLKQQIQSGIAHMSYPYTFADEESYEADILCFLYQMDLYDFETNDLLQGRQIPIKATENALAEQSFMVQVFQRKEVYVLNLEYLRESYERESAVRYAEYFEKIVSYLLWEDDRLIGYVRNEE